MVEKNGSVLSFWTWNVKKWQAMVAKMLNSQKDSKKTRLFDFQKSSLDR